MSIQLHTLNSIALRVVLCPNARRTFSCSIGEGCNACGALYYHNRQCTNRCETQPCKRTTLAVYVPILLRAWHRLRSVARTLSDVLFAILCNICNVSVLFSMPSWSWTLFCDVRLRCDSGFSDLPLRFFRKFSPYLFDLGLFG